MSSISSRPDDIEGGKVKKAISKEKDKLINSQKQQQQQQQQQQPLIQSQQQQQSLSSQSQSQQQQNQSQQSRASKQSSYKEKIKDIAIDFADWNEDQEDQYNCEIELGQDAPEASKSEKIRLSAQMTRKRRKIYIELLEKKIKSINEELAQAKAKLEQSQTVQKQQSTSQSDNPTIMVHLKEERQKLFDKLEEKIKEKDDLEIEYIMDSMRLRLGLAGKTRTQALNSFFDQIVNLIMPFHMKYLIWIASENLDLFDSEKAESESQESVWFKNSNLSEEAITDVKSKIVASKTAYDELLHSMDAMKSSIMQLNEEAQNFVDDLRNFFPPINVAKFLVELDKKRDLYERNNLYPGSLWSELCKQSKDQRVQKNTTLQQQLQQQITTQHMQQQQSLSAVSNNENSLLLGSSINSSDFREGISKNNSNYVTKKQQIVPTAAAKIESKESHIYFQLPHDVSSHHSIYQNQNGNQSYSGHEQHQQQQNPHTQYQQQQQHRHPLSNPQHPTQILPSPSTTAAVQFENCSHHLSEGSQQVSGIPTPAMTQSQNQQSGLNVLQQQQQVVNGLNVQFNTNPLLQENMQQTSHSVFNNNHLLSSCVDLLDLRGNSSFFIEDHSHGAHSTQPYMSNLEVVPLLNDWQSQSSHQLQQQQSQQPIQQSQSYNYFYENHNNNNNTNLPQQTNQQSLSQSQQQLQQRPQLRQGNLSQAMQSAIATSRGYDAYAQQQQTYQSNHSLQHQGQQQHLQHSQNHSNQSISSKRGNSSN